MTPSKLPPIDAGRLALVRGLLEVLLRQGDAAHPVGLEEHRPLRRVARQRAARRVSDLPGFARTSKQGR
jgi:hypothetical protein